LGKTGQKTGFWLEELAAPYYALKEADVDVVLASPKGGEPPLDPKSNSEEFKTEHTKRFQADSAAMQALKNTKKVEQVDEKNFDAIFVPGGHGPLWDLAEDSKVFWLLEKFSRAKKPIAAVCHGPAVFKHMKSIVEGFKVTSFTNAEEEQVGLTKVVPFLVEDMLISNGAKFTHGEPWHSFVVSDNNGLLITGQNPQSSVDVAKALLKQLGK